MDCIIVGRTDKQSVIQIPSLALETRIALAEKPPLNSRLTAIEMVRVRRCARIDGASRPARKSG